MCRSLRDRHPAPRLLAWLTALAALALPASALAAEEFKRLKRKLARVEKTRLEPL